MKNHGQQLRFASLVGLVLVTIVSVAQLSAAADAPEAIHPPIKLANLKGPWQIALIGNTGCGFTSMLVNVTLNASGSGSATITSHSGCGDGTQGGLPFLIQTLNASASGTANLSCGTGCGWEFNIQVSRNVQIFNLVDVDPTNPGNNSVVWTTRMPTIAFPSARPTAGSADLLFSFLHSSIAATIFL